MKRILLLLLIAFSLSAKSQVYNNEWIDYNKTYYKFKVANTGIYRISQSALASIGLASTNADHFQLWHNGQQVILYTSVQNAPLGTADYIDFWGEQNDGKPDNALYRQSDWQLNDKYSLQTDTAAYFLTVNTAGGNLRFATTPNNVAGNTLAPEPYYMYSTGEYFHEVINTGRSELVGSSYTYSSSYDYGEGWTTANLATGATRTTLLPNLKAYTGPGAPSSTININAAGNAVNARYFRVKLNGDSVYSQAMDYYDYVKANFSFNTSLLSSDNATIEVTNRCDKVNDRMVIAKTELIYPRLFSGYGLSSLAFDLPANAAGNYVEVSDFTFNGPPLVLYDFSNRKRYEVDPFAAGAIRKIALEPSAVDRSLILVNEATIRQVTLFEQRKFVDYKITANQGDYLIISHPVLTSATAGGDPVEDYRTYRASATGGSYNAKVYMIDQLVDQFAFGIKKHPSSIRNFLRWARANYSAPLKDVLLIGKGITYTFFRSYETDPNVEKLDLVPTFGYPASDNLLSAEGSSSIPLTPIGRISVINKTELSVYLKKVKEYEQTQKISSPTIGDKAWMKNIVHVTGASDDNTSNILLNALNGHKTIIEDSLYAGNVHTFTKSTADAVQQVNSTRLAGLFSDGIGILTYFGHSSSSSLEFNLDNPQNYNNPGKYPVFIVMGCNAGSFFNFNTARFDIKETLSEKYVLAPDGGSIAFLASTHLGIVHYLDIYNTRTYRALSRTNYGGTLGEVMDEAISQVFALTTENDFYARFQCEQFTLHGDPAIRLYGFNKPDYVIEDPSVKVSPNFISISETSFKVDAEFFNIGKASKENVVVEIKRTYPNLSTVVVKRDTIPFTKFSDTLSFDLPIVASRDKGLNKITITIDPENKIDELYETNNTITKDVYIIDNDAKPVYPYNYSIVNSQNIKLVASSADPFSVSKKYFMEMDTTALFNSSVKITQSITSVGGVFEFTPSIVFKDSTVYYWRVAPEVTTGDMVWNMSSFQYIANEYAGFSQAHYFQFEKNKYDRIKYNEARKFEFTPTAIDIEVTSGIYPYAGETAHFALNINGVRTQAGLYGPLGVNSNSLRFYVIDGTTSRPWVNQIVGSTGMYGSYAPIPINGTVKPGFYLFDVSTQAARTNVMNFIDLIPQGDYIAICNSGVGPTVLPSVWMNDTLALGSGNSLYHKMYNLGFSNLSSMTTFVPFVFSVKKGDVSTSKQVISGFQAELARSIFDIEGIGKSGHFESEDLGPAKKWGTLKWNGYSLDPGSDDVKIRILGVKNDNTVDTLATIPEGQYEVPIDWIDANLYPSLRLRLSTVDSVHYTPYQLRYWMATYDPVPEGAIAPGLYFTTKDTVEVGEPMSFGIAFKNVSKVPFDSIKVKLAITDKNNIENIIPIPRQKNLQVGDTIKLDVPIDTKGLSGRNILFVNFNPDNDQLEQHLFNNYAFRSLYVRPDSLNPLLDVTFDGVRILNRDIVASKPDIIVKLKDEAKWMVLDDTTLLTVNVKYPDGSIKRVYFTNNSDTLQFIPAGQAPNAENTASINFKPYFSQDGEYELIVTGKDRSNNTAGMVQYRVAFQVINKSMISNMLNYPNPFTTSTAFVFTLTGSEIPQNIRIQVLTITGKVVREITKDELGPLHIGRNITEFKWDGTDQYGQKLANGIYLYRVITNQNGKSLDKYKADGDNTDKYFNKGYGKMYLMR